MKHSIQTFRNSFTPRRAAIVAISLAGTLVLSGGAYAAFFTPTIRPNVMIGPVSVGNMSYQDAIEALNNKVTPVRDNGLTLNIAQRSYTITPAAINLSYDVQSAVDAAWAIGRQGSPLSQVESRATTLITTTTIPLPVSFDEHLLQNEIDRIAHEVETPPKDVRLIFNGTSVTVATDTALGQVMNRPSVESTLEQALHTLTPGPYSVTLTQVIPSGDPASAPQAAHGAENILSFPLILTNGRDSFTINSETIATWLTSTIENSQLHVEVNNDLVRSYLTNLDTQLNVAPIEPSLIVEDNRVKSFSAPKSGKALDIEQSLTAITHEIERRKADNTSPLPITLVAKITQPQMSDPVARQHGIQELIGTATTDFSGSPTNRIWNIKTGARYLNNILVAPGEEFSTTGTLGAIDASTGYRPELVIKGTRTLPEYGGGLCQVSTTLFRATMDTGLPITSRYNHAYRVGYYEKDGNGKKIGPGLDATIYSPNPDFRFKNDTPGYLLITNAIYGTKITFSIYGTSDGRTSQVDGPYTLKTTPPGDPVYVETDTLPPGEKKQVEHPHAGGSAIATYIVTYADGTIKKNVFKSTYKNWPPTFLVGKAATTTPAPATDPNQTTPPIDSTTPVTISPTDPVPPTTPTID